MGIFFVFNDNVLELIQVIQKNSSYAVGPAPQNCHLASSVLMNIATQTRVPFSEFSGMKFAGCGCYVLFSSKVPGQPFKYLCILWKSFETLAEQHTFLWMTSPAFVHFSSLLAWMEFTCKKGDGSEGHKLLKLVSRSQDRFVWWYLARLVY